MLSEITNATAILRSARARHGHAMRGERRAAVELLRACLDIALPMIAAEAVDLPPAKQRSRDGLGYELIAAGRGFLIIDRTEHEQHRAGHDELDTWEGPQLWARPDGALVEVLREDSRPRWEERRDRCYEPPREIGLREAVRRWGADTLVRELLAALMIAAQERQRAAACCDDRADRFRAALTMLNRS